MSVFISLETGHHAFALDAIDWNAIAVDAWYFRRDSEMDRGDGKAVPVLFDDDVGFDVHLLGHEVRHSKHSGMVAPWNGTSKSCRFLRGHPRSKLLKRFRKQILELPNR
jgi:hypothetical protein